MCGSCSAAAPEGARFCSSCGTPLAPDLGRDEERRIVTILFADLVGFTTLSEQRDPESVKRLVDRIFEQLVSDVEAHGGLVDKVLGDAIVALFGAPVAHEDDADRAVRAALAMQASVQRLASDNPAEAVQMRVGINTGEVLVGTLAGTDYTAMGDVVNTAARLQEVAHPGSVLVGEATRELCSSAISLERVDAVRLRGREQETNAWRALGVESGVVARRWNSDVEFVGRAGEMAMLRAITGRVLDGRGAIVSITGEPGIGKSRLAGEAVLPMLERHPDTLLVEGACAPYGESNVWWPVAGGFISRLGLDRGETPEESKRLVERRLSTLDDLAPGTPEFERTVDLVLHLLGHPSGLDTLGSAGTREAVATGIVETLRRRVEHGPAILWIDDIQWAAPVLLELLETIARRLARAPLLIITTCRPDDGGADKWPPSVDPALTLHLSLDPLEDADAATLVDIAAGRHLPDDVVAGISSRSGGNPLFLIELSRLAAASDDPTATVLPGSLRALIAARLDQLTAPQRQIVDNAAIIGNGGPIASLRQFALEVGQHFDDADLAAIEAAGLMNVRRQRWSFRSDVIREVAYQTLTKEARAQRHAGVARYLAVRDPGLLDRRAHHAATAAELVRELGPVRDVPDDVAVDAVWLLTAAAESWADQGAHRRALGVIERALAFDVTDESVEGRLLLLRAESLVEVRDMSQARRRTAELVAFADRTGNRVLRGESERLLGQIEQISGDLVLARTHLATAVAEFRQLGDEPRLAEALRARGFAEVFGGSLADADHFLDEAEQVFARVDDPRGMAWVSQHRAWVSFLSGDHVRSEERLLQAIDEFTALEDRSGAAWSRGLLAYVYHFTRRNDEALALAVGALEDASQWGDDWGASMMYNLQASVTLWRGDIETARHAAERALAGFRRIDDRFGMIQALSTLNRAYVALGRNAEADRSVEEVLALADNFGELAYPLVAAAGTAMHRGAGRRAAELASEAVDRLDTTGANVDEGRVIVAFGHLLDGDVDATLSTLLDVDVERSPFALAARATAYQVLRDAERALDDVRTAEAIDGASYWDRAVVAIAGYAAAEGDEALARRDALEALVAGVDDIVIQAYARAVLHPGEALGPPAPGGWGELAARLVSSAA